MYDPKYYQAHKEHKREQQRRHYWEHREEKLAQVHKYREKNREKLSRKFQKYRQEHLPLYCEYSKQYYERNREYILGNIQQRRLRVLKFYGNGQLACVKCGFSDARALSIDHIHNDGAEHRKELGIKGGSLFYKWLIKNDFPTGYQTLCLNCQKIKYEEFRFLNRS